MAHSHRARLAHLDRSSGARDDSSACAPARCGRLRGWHRSGS